jgi:hypothetical protein
VALIGAAIGKAARQAGAEGLFCADWRHLTVLAPEIAQELAQRMKGGNQLSLRSAALINDRATFGLQIERLIRAAEHPSRRAFRDPNLLLEWLGEVATREEAERARAFLLEPPTSAAGPSPKS